MKKLLFPFEKLLFPLLRIKKKSTYFFLFPFSIFISLKWGKINTMNSVPMSAEGRVENQNERKRPPLCGRLGSFWFSNRFTGKKSDLANAENRVDGCPR